MTNVDPDAGKGVIKRPKPRWTTTANEEWVYFIGFRVYLGFTLV